MDDLVTKLYSFGELQCLDFLLALIVASVKHLESISSWILLPASSAL